MTHHDDALAHWQHMLAQPLGTFHPEETHETRAHHVARLIEDFHTFATIGDQ